MERGRKVQQVHRPGARLPMVFGQVHGSVYDLRTDLHHVESAFVIGPELGRDAIPGRFARVSKRRSQRRQHLKRDELGDEEPSGEAVQCASHHT